MKLSDINAYVEELHNDLDPNQGQYLIKFEVKSEADPDFPDDFYVTQTKETYVFGDEEAADRKINAVRTDKGFAGVDKKFKPGKVNKAGEQVKPDTYTVVVKINF